MERRVDRLDKYIKFRGLNDNKVTLDSGISVGTLGKSRKEGKDITPKTAEMILEVYPELNRVWLMTGEGEMLGTKKPTDFVSYPLLDVSRAECGKAFGIASTVRVTELPYISIPGVPVDTEFFVQASGHSMINKQNPELSIPTGALVGLAKITTRVIRWGEVYALSTADGVMIKRVFESEDKNLVRCVSYNSEEYPDFEIERRDIFELARITCVIPISLR